MDPRPIGTIVDPAVSSAATSPLVGHAFAFLVALGALLAIGAVLFLWRRHRVRTLGRADLTQ